MRTGPNRAFDGLKYVYTEISGEAGGNVARLQSVDFTLGEGAFFSIQHSMWGIQLGTLDVDVIFDGTKSRRLWTATGNQGPGWEPIILDIGDDINTPGRVISFLFSYTKVANQSAIYGDVGLDDFQAYLGAGATGAAPMPASTRDQPQLPSSLSSAGVLPGSDDAESEGSSIMVSFSVSVLTALAAAAVLS